jgi:hypothetical protein
MSPGLHNGMDPAELAADGAHPSRVVAPGVVCVTHTRTRTGSPLAVMEGVPLRLDGAELSPAAIRALASMLARIADDCDALSAASLARRAGAMPVRREYRPGDGVATLGVVKGGAA